MPMDWFIFQLIIGLALLLGGANFLTDGAVKLAQRFKVSEMFIGLTIVAVGTSLPELMVSSIAGFQGNSDIAIGNIVGSNIFNILFILGLTALAVPIKLTKENIRLDIPLCIAASVLLFLVCSDTFLGGSTNQISRIEGIAMLLLYFVFIGYMLHISKKHRASQAEQAESVPAKQSKLWLVIVMVIGGLAALIGGAQLFLDGSVALARKIGVSDSVIAILLLAGGTSLPELATTLTAAIKKRTDIAVGNVLGSNIANILLILGLSASINPLRLGNITTIDLLMVLFCTLLVLVSAFTFRKKYIDRPEGLLFVACYVLYVVFLLNSQPQ